MNSFFQRIKPAHLLFCALFFEFINVGYFWRFFKANHYLPAPFILDKNDTFMDFYNPLFWVIKDGFYTTFNSVYPAINYFFIKIFTLGIAPDNISSPFQLRDDFPRFGIIITSLYVLIIFVVVNIGQWRKVDASHWSRGVIFLACLISTPVLFGLERGNLIFLAVLFLALYLNATSPWIKAICLGVLINIKPYFAILLLQYCNLYQINKGQLVRSIVAILALFTGFGIIANMNFLEFFKSYLAFSKNSTLSVEGIISFPHSIAALSTIKALINFGEGSRYTFWFSLIKAINYIGVLVLIIISLTRKLSSRELLISAILIITNFSISTGGYILIMYIVIIPYLIKDLEYRYLLIGIIAIYAIPMDLFQFFRIEHIQLQSYLGGNIASNNYPFLSLGSIVRPILNFYLMMSFLIHIIKKYPDGFRSLKMVA